MLEYGPDRVDVLGFTSVESLGPGGQVGAEPVEGLFPPAGPLALVQRGGVRALAGRGQGGGAGGVVAVLAVEVVRQRRLPGESKVVELGRGSVVPPVHL